MRRLRPQALGMEHDDQTSDRPAARAPALLWRRLTIAIVALALLALIVWSSPQIAAFVARRVAAQRINELSTHTALWWLDRAARLRPDDWRTDLMNASCQRQLRQMDRWQEAIQAAERNGAPPSALDIELKLQALQFGDALDTAKEVMDSLADAGAAPWDVAGAYFSGCLLRNEQDRALALLQQWTAMYPDDPHTDYLWGLYTYSQGDAKGAEERLRSVLDRQPHHELARSGLAEMLAADERLEEARQHYAQLVMRSGGGEIASTGLARVLRRLARIDEARSVLAPIISRPDPGSAARAEMAQIELDAGQYLESQRWLRSLPGELSLDLERLNIMAIAMALAGDVLDGDRLFRQFRSEVYRAGRMRDLGIRAETNPAAAAEMRRMAAGTAPIYPRDHLPPIPPPPPDDGDAQARTAWLYAFHCSACHGHNGDGRGRADRHLFPPASILRGGPVKLVSTRNGVPALDDIKSVLRNGIPGTAMAARPELNDRDITLLAEEVLRLRREGLKEQIAQAFLAEGEEPEEEDLLAAVELGMTPSEPIEPPQFPPPDPATIGRGKQAYVDLGCNKCHGPSGSGPPEQQWYDDRGYPEPPRDLVLEPFKGGLDPQSIFLRIAAGMPGTSHPSASTAGDAVLADLTRYVLSLGQPQRLSLTNYTRREKADP